MKLPFALAARFVAGETLESALPKIRQLNVAGLRTTVDLLGEYVKDPAVAEASRDAYIHLVRSLGQERRRDLLDANISIKLSMLGQKIDRDFCLRNLRRVLDAARQADVFVRLDMEGSDITQSTLDLFEAVYPEYRDHVGTVLQSYLKRTDRDVDRMIELGARVRLVKGAYKEPPDLAYQDMPTIRAHFTDQMRRLLEHGRYPAIATHDDRLIQTTMAFAAERGIDPARFEFQMLYGIRPETQLAIARQGYNVRVYVPYGTQWLPYFTRRLRERKENVWFVLSNLYKR